MQVLAIINDRNACRQAGRESGGKREGIYLAERLKSF